MKSKIVHVLCEGQTEQGFVDAVLKHYLRAHGVQAVKSVILTTNKKKNARGGMLSFTQAQNDLRNLMLSNQDGEYERHIFTTMFDLYALPNDFPSYADATAIPDRYARVEKLEEAYLLDLNSPRFIPYIQLHEFEALVLCGIPYLKSLYPDSDKRCDQLQTDVNDIGNPELVNDTPATAPSKRIISAIEGDRKTHYNYNKPASGKYVTKQVGIEALRTQCSHFDQWVQKLLDA